MHLVSVALGRVSDASSEQLADPDPDNDNSRDIQKNRKTQTVPSHQLAVLLSKGGLCPRLLFAPELSREGDAWIQGPWFTRSRAY